MADNNDFSRHVKIKKEYKEIDKKVDFNSLIKSLELSTNPKNTTCNYLYYYYSIAI